jgi:[ribosomal protein S5]-alanine N-acetyltransferase
VGVAGLRVTDRMQAEGHVGYALRRRFWNRGYATDACAALLQLGFETLGLHRIQATVTVDNHSSIRVLQKLGMRREGYLVEHLRIHGTWMDSLLFAMLDREWRPSQPDLS